MNAEVIVSVQSAQASRADGEGRSRTQAQAQAQANLALLFEHVMRLATCGETASLPLGEAHELLSSICFVLGIEDLDSLQAIEVLSQPDPLEYFRMRQEALRQRAQEAMALWERVCLIMPPVRNIALRDTLLSLGSFKRRYDVLFAAHQIPCDIDYPLSCPVPESLKGVDYVMAWLEQLQREAEYLAQFNLADLERMLGASCPDYIGLHVNLYDLVSRASRSPIQSPCKRASSIAAGALLLKL